MVIARVIAKSIASVMNNANSTVEYFLLILTNLTYKLLVETDSADTSLLGKLWVIQPQ